MCSGPDALRQEAEAQLGLPRLAARRRESFSVGILVPGGSEKKVLPISWGSFERDLGLLQRGLGLI